MNINETLVPHILCAMSSAPDQQQSLSKIVRFVEENLGDEANQITNIKSEVEKALGIAVEFGLLSSHNNIVRLRYNPNSKPPLGFQVMDSQRESRRSSMQMDEEMEEMDSNSGATPINDNKVSSDSKTKNSKNARKDTSDFSFFPVPSEIKRRRRKSRSRGKRKRSRSRRRRRRR